MGVYTGSVYGKWEASSWLRVLLLSPIQKHTISKPLGKHYSDPSSGISTPLPSVFFLFFLFVRENSSFHVSAWQRLHTLEQKEEWMVQLESTISRAKCRLIDRICGAILIHNNNGDDQWAANKKSIMYIHKHIITKPQTTAPVYEPTRPINRILPSEEIFTH